MTVQNEKNTPEPLSFATFLQSVPPGAERTISDLFGLKDHPHRVGTGLPKLLSVNTPDIQLHCPTETCRGVRIFECRTFHGPPARGDSENFFLTYTCRNCRKGFKTYALLISREQAESGSAVKYGEMPAFGPPLPARLLKMVGGDGALLRKGRRAENQSLGIGAFAYYRRVVENQKDRLLEEFHKAAVRLGADQELLDEIDRAKGETIQQIPRSGER